VSALGALLFLLAAHPAKAQQKAEWTWKDKSGTTRTLAELNSILREHERWAFSDGKSGKRANLMGAHLERAHLGEVELARADFKGANLSHADLSGADLTDADLSQAELHETDLRDAHLIRADLTRATLTSANLSGAELDEADLRGALLMYANLSGTALNNGNLSGADLRWAKLSEAHLWSAALREALFEPGSNPEIRSMATARDLELMTYRDNPDALVQLRKQFADGGFRDQERKITYALKRKEAALSSEGCTSRKLSGRFWTNREAQKGSPPTRAFVWSSDSNVANCGSFVLNRVFFEWTCQYGMSPGRPLRLGVLLWLLCSLLYFAYSHISGEGGLYRIYAPSVQEDAAVPRRVERIRPEGKLQGRGVRRILRFFRREWLVLRTSMFFSLMSAFNIGFRDINFGRWLRLLTRQEFDINAVGWVRVIAGWQSLISVYFIALWVLTYFGRPFG